MSENQMNEAHENLEEREILWVSFRQMMAAFAYCVVELHPIDVPQIEPVLVEYAEYVKPVVSALSPLADPNDSCLMCPLTVEQLNHMINESTLSLLPAVHALNKIEKDFVDLGELARNTTALITGICRDMQEPPLLSEGPLLSEANVAPAPELSKIARAVSVAVTREIKDDDGVRDKQ